MEDTGLGGHSGSQVSGKMESITREGDDAGPWEVPFAMVWEMRDGRAIRLRQYGDSVLMRAAAGAPPA